MRTGHLERPRKRVQKGTIGRSRKVDGVWKLPYHPGTCPKSRTILEEAPKKTGAPAGKGRWKNFCPDCGVIYYDVNEGE